MSHRPCLEKKGSRQSPIGWNNCSNPRTLRSSRVNSWEEHELQASLKTQGDSISKNKGEYKQVQREYDTL